MQSIVEFIFDRPQLLLVSLTPCFASVTNSCRWFPVAWSRGLCRCFRPLPPLLPPAPLLGVGGFACFGFWRDVCPLDLSSGCLLCFLLPLVSLRASAAVASPLGGPAVSPRCFAWRCGPLVGRHSVMVSIVLRPM